MKVLVVIILFVEFIASKASDKLCESPYPCLGGPNGSSYVSLHLMVPMPKIINWNKSFPITFYDEEGNSYGMPDFTDVTGLQMRDPTGKILWTQPDVEPFLVQQDGTVIGFTGRRTMLVLVAPDGSILKSLPVETSSMANLAIAHTDGGITAGTVRYDNELNLVYRRPEERVMDTIGNVWIVIHDNGAVYAGLLDDAGNEIKLYRVGDLTFDGRGQIAGIDSSGNFYTGQYYGIAKIFSPGGSVLFEFHNGSFGSWFTKTSDGLAIFERYEYPNWYDIGLTNDFQQIRLAGGYWDPDYPWGDYVSRFDGSGNVFVYYTAPGDWDETYKTLSGQTGVSAGGGVWAHYYEYSSGLIPHPDGLIVVSASFTNDGGTQNYTNFYAPPQGFLAHANLKDGNGGAADIQYRFVVKGQAGDMVSARRLKSKAHADWQFYTAPGSYRVLIKAPFTLLKAVSQSVTTGFPESSIALPAGDLVDDNRIDLYDLNAEFIDPIDLNNDGEVDFSDIAIIFQNFGLRGDE